MVLSAGGVFPPVLGVHPLFGCVIVLWCGSVRLAFHQFRAGELWEGRKHTHTLGRTPSPGPIRRRDASGADRWSQDFDSSKCPFPSILRGSTTSISQKVSGKVRPSESARNIRTLKQSCPSTVGPSVARSHFCHHFFGVGHPFRTRHPPTHTQTHAYFHPPWG